jgi:hypothetical protein
MGYFLTAPKKQNGRKQSIDRSLPFSKITNSSPQTCKDSGGFFPLCRRSHQEQITGQFFRNLGHRVTHGL